MPRSAPSSTAETGAELFYDWAGGLLWVEMPDGAPREGIVRAALGGQGHATLMRADVSQRTGDMFEPLEPSLAALAKRVKESFDPKGVLNPGRMYAESAMRDERLSSLSPWGNEQPSGCERVRGAAYREALPPHPATRCARGHPLPRGERGRSAQLTGDRE